MAVPPPLPEDHIREALAILAEMEELIVEFPREEIFKKLDEIRDFVDAFTRYQVDVRMLKLRLQSKLLPQQDPDKTPVHGISSATLAAARMSRTKKS